MKKDIPFLPVQGVNIAVSRQLNELGEYAWNVYLLNRNDFSLDNVFVRSKGYGINADGEREETSVLRHHIPAIEAGEWALIEPIMPEVFHLNNEYWVSYYIGSQVYDKKFIFVPDSIIDSNLVYIPQLKSEGILHS